MAQNGMKIGGSIAYLAASSDSQQPESYLDPEAAYRARNLGILRDKAQTQADCKGAVPVAIHPDGSATPLVPVDSPCVAFETWAEQRSPDYMESTQTGFTSTDRTEKRMVLRRFARDGIRQLYVSYEVTVEPLPGGTYRLSFGPSPDQPPADVRGEGDWKVLAPARYPVPQIVGDADAVRVELYSNGFRKMVDYVHAGRPDRMVMRTEAPRDYYAEDAELTVTMPHFRVNGAAFEAVASLPETLRGPVLWVYIPGHGRYVLSLHSHPDLGFADAGEAAGNSLTFTSDGNVFRVDTVERIAAGSGTYTLRMLQDPGWLPADPQDRAPIMVGTVPAL